MRFFSLVVILLSSLLAGEISTTTPVESLSVLGVHEVKLSSHLLKNFLQKGLLNLS